jgi:acyl-homoserine lactone synthase
MIEAHVVGELNRRLYEKEWDAYLRIRQDIYVREKRWRPESQDGRELDQFDTPDATYLLGIEDGEVVAGARFIPTIRPNLACDVFAHMCDMCEVPRHRNWADWTRTFVAPRKRSASRRGTLFQLFCASMQFCVEQGVEHAGGVQATYFLPLYRIMDWHIVPMGMPKLVAGEWSVVAYIRCDGAALAGIRRLLGPDLPPLVARGPQKPFFPHAVAA